MPATLDLGAWKGNDVSWTFRFDGEDGNPLDLTGAVLVFRATAPGMTPIRKSSPASGISIASPATGIAVVTLSETETRSLPDGLVAEFEIELRDGSTQTTILAGRIQAAGGVNDDL